MVIFELQARAAVCGVLYCSMRVSSRCFGVGCWRLLVVGVVGGHFLLGGHVALMKKGFETSKV